MNLAVIVAVAQVVVVFGGDGDGDGDYGGDVGDGVCGGGLSM